MKRRNVPPSTSQNLCTTSETTEQKQDDISLSNLPSFNLEENLVNMTKLNSKNFTNLVISSGGTNGLTMLGALMYLEQQKTLSNITNYVGTSVGSIITLLLSMDMSPFEIYQYLLDNDFSKEFQIFNIENILNYNSLFSNKLLIDNYEKVITSKLDFVPTLAELYELTKKKWTAVTFNYTKHKIEYISYETHPDLPCSIAAAASSCIPLFFSMIDINGNKYIDGGITDSCHLKYSYKNKIEGDVICITLGEEYVPELKSENKLKNLVTFLTNVFYINIKTKFYDNLEFSSKKDDVVFFTLPVKTGTGFKFTMDKMDKIDLFNKGFIYLKNVKKLLDKVDKDKGT
jgi:NTE family protein